MEKPLVSIIMGTYNGQNRISDCIDSMINQTYKNWEFIICDDSSTDNTYEILKCYSKKDHRIKIIRNNQNMKLAASLNKCLDVSTGVYIARIDDDDIALENRLEKQVDFLNTHPEYAVVGSNVFLYDGENIIGKRKAKEFPNKNDVLLGPTFMHPTIMMRKSVYDNLNGYTVSEMTKRGQDWDLWFRFYSKGYVGYNIQEELLLYHESADDHKKRTFKSSLGYHKIAKSGYKLLQVPKRKYIFTFKPILSYFIPEIIKKKRRHEN